MNHNDPFVILCSAIGRLHIIDQLAILAIAATAITSAIICMFRVVPVTQERMQRIEQMRREIDEMRNPPKQ